MSIWTWIKEWVFNDPPLVSYRGHRPPEHPPGWKNIQRAKKKKSKTPKKAGK